MATTITNFGRVLTDAEYAVFKVKQTEVQASGVATSAPYPITYDGRNAFEQSWIDLASAQSYIDWENTTFTPPPIVAIAQA